MEKVEMSSNNINESVGKSFLPKFLTDLFNSPAENERVAPNIAAKLPENAPSWMPKMLTNVLADPSVKPLNASAKEFIPASAATKRLNPNAAEFTPASGGRRRKASRKARKASRKVARKSSRKARRSSRSGRR